MNDYPLKFRVTAPYQTFDSIHTKSVSDTILKAVQINSNFFKTKTNFILQISCMDVSFGGIGISFGDDGFHVWETESGLIRVSKLLFPYLLTKLI